MKLFSFFPFCYPLSESSADMSFSSAVILTDLNDFITPSQVCIKPIESTKIEGSNKRVNIKDGEYYEVEIDGSESQLEKASITLSDCLACSGCITSAESVLITMQSHQELIKVLQERKYKIIVVSISSQSRASFAAKYNLTTDQIWAKFNNYFKSLGIDYVFDIDFARDIALIESGKEFVRIHTSASPTPILQSSCPGFICYAEKTHGDILQYIQSTKSPQQIMGSLVKNYMADKLCLQADEIYHFSVMPCYDKKLEASRDDFYNEIYKCRDVDLVISTSELETMITEQIDFKDISDLYEVDVNVMQFPFVKGCLEGLFSSEGSSSGGYLSFILRYSIYTLYQINVTPMDIQLGTNGITITAGRNQDFTTVSYTPPGFTESTLKFAYSYGFRNIQNLVRKLKPKKSNRGGKFEYHFVEVMACPSGCSNGGGQLKVPENMAAKELLNLVESRYKESRFDVQGPEGNVDVKQVYQEWLGGEDTELSRKMLHTQYHAVPVTIPNGLAVKW
jgi:iron only hydrogenase large subunit-like protein